MEMNDWLELARKEQCDSTDEAGSHLYANYQYTLRHRLIKARALQKFIRNIPKAVIGSAPDEDEASRLAYKVAVSQYKSPPKNGKVADFRLMGKRVRTNTDYFANLTQELTFYPSVTVQGGAPFSPGFVPQNASLAPGSLSDTGIARRIKPGGVLWLTRWDSVLEIARQLRPVSRNEFFVGLVDWLGLKPKGYPWRNAKSTPWNLRITLRLYKRTEKTNLSRPHALSGGYSDRFCCATAFAPYGSTAQCSTGAAFLPEAITALSEVVEVLASEKEYSAAVAALGAIDATLLSGRNRTEPLAAVISSSSFAPHNGYLELQRAILARL